MIISPVACDDGDSDVHYGERKWQWEWKLSENTANAFCETEKFTSLFTKSNTGL
jgi:hypothetical protein